MGVIPRRSSAGPALDVSNGDAAGAADTGAPTSRFGALWSRGGSATGPAAAGPTEPATGRFGRRRDRLEAGRAPVEPSPADPGLKPSTMRGSEGLYGYVVGLELLVVGVLNLTVTHGPGAPAHPQTTLAAVGVAASIAFMAVIRLKNRMAAGFGAIVAAFFVTLPRVPNSMSIAHIFALVVPMAYGLIITQRQRRDTPKLARGAARGAAARGSGASPAGGRTGGKGAGTTPAGAGRGRRGKKQAEPANGPRPSARYTPPKSKRKS